MIIICREANMQAIKRRPSVRRGGIIYLSVEDIEPSPVQPRKTFDDGDINELSQSIAEYGNSAKKCRLQII